MNVTSKISVDLTRPNVGARINAVQGDGNTRFVEITLLADGAAWTLPSGSDASIAYYQPDGHKGLYNKLADGTGAISISGNVVTVILAPQMLTVSGTVQVTLVFDDAKLNRLTSFPFSVSVASNPAAGAQKTEDYYRLQWLEDKLGEWIQKMISTENAVAAGIAADKAYTAANRAQESATAANEAANRADTAATGANSARDAANAAAASSNNAAAAANRSAQAADLAASGANTARDEANQAAQEARGQAGAASTAAQKASDAAGAAKEAEKNANDAAGWATEVAVKVQQKLENGEFVGPRGDALFAALEVDDDGHLHLLGAENTGELTFTLNEETGNLEVSYG